MSTKFYITKSYSPRGTLLSLIVMQYVYSLLRSFSRPYLNKGQAIAMAVVRRLSVCPSVTDG